MIRYQQKNLSFHKNQKIIKSIPITLNKMSFFEFIKLSELKFENKILSKYKMDKSNDVVLNQAKLLSRSKLQSS